MRQKDKINQLKAMFWLIQIKHVFKCNQPKKIMLKIDLSASPLINNSYNNNSIKRASSSKVCDTKQRLWMQKFK